MDCVNHSGVNRGCLLPELRQGALRQLRAQRGRRTDSLRSLLDGVAELFNSPLPRLPPADPTPRPPPCWD